MFENLMDDITVEEEKLPPKKKGKKGKKKKKYTVNMTPDYRPYSHCGKRTETT